MARVFVGIPTYNRPEMVQDAIRSLIAQRFADWRAVVSDNRSDGDAGDRVERFVAQLGDSRVTFHRQPANEGEYGQGRFFLTASAGCDYFVILHDDDVLLPGYLAAGVEILDGAADVDLFVANAYGAGPEGRPDPALTRAWLRAQGRVNAEEGRFDVLAKHLDCGFAPISGTLLRRAALERSGFVDADLGGNYPFEANVFLCLGEHGAKGWFRAEELLGVRMHAGALSSQRLMRDARLVAACVQLWSRRRFTGALERRRRVLLSRYRRADALLALEAGDYGRARRTLAGALRDDPTSVKCWALAPLVVAMPSALRAALQRMDA